MAHGKGEVLLGEVLWRRAAVQSNGQAMIKSFMMAVKGLVKGRSAMVVSEESASFKTSSAPPGGRARVHQGGCFRLLA